MTKEEVLNTIIEHYKNGSTSALSDYCDITRCSGCPFDSDICTDEVSNTLIDRLTKAEEKKETNLEHYFKVGDVIVYGGQQYIYLNDNCWDAYDKSKTSHIVDWLLSPYEESKPKYKITQFEYDLLKSYGEETRSIDIFCYFSLDMMRKKGYFKGIQGTATFGDVLDNCEVVEE